MPCHEHVLIRSAPRNKISRSTAISLPNYMDIAVIFLSVVTNFSLSSFAIAHDMRIRRGHNRRKILQFADCTRQSTVGQVETYWTFASGKRIPITFEVLEDCCADIIIGEEALFYYNVYEDHADSFTTESLETDAYQLAPFDILTRWHRKVDNAMQRMRPNSATYRWENGMMSPY